MRIVYFGPQDLPAESGAMISILLTVDALRGLGHDARVVSAQDPPEWSPVDVPWLKTSEFDDELRGADAAITGWPGIEPALRAGVPTVAHLCAGYDKLLWPRLADEISAAYKKPTVKLVVSPHLRDVLREDLGIDSTFVGTALVPEWFREASQQHTPAVDGAPTRILSVGSDPDTPFAPIPFKGIANVIKIVRSARERGRELELVRMCSRPDSLLESDAVDEARVGVIPRDAPAVYASCDVFLSASTAAEGLGKPAVEAALTGTPAILPEIPSYAGLPELRSSALFYPPGDLAAAADRLEELLDDPDLRQRLSAAGPDIAIDDRFRPEAVAARVAAALEDAQTGGSRRSRRRAARERRPSGRPGSLRIAHLTATFPPYPGGAGNTAYRFARGQAERGHHVEVFTAAAEGEAPDPGDAVVHRIDPVMAIGNAPLIPSLARLDSFDVVHVHYPFIFGSELTLLGRLRKRRRSAALIVHYKNRLLGSGPRGVMFETYERTVAPALIRAADRVLVLSEDHARSVSYLNRALERSPERVIEMPNGVDTDAFSPGPDQSGLREELGIPAGATVAAFVATLDRAHHFKRVDVAIEALARTRARDLHMIVAGGGELLDGFRAEAAAAGVGARVHFLGGVPHAELPDVLRASDLFVLTTEPPESFGIVLIEAMACGLPAIATDYPGVRAVVTEETGILTPAGDSGEAAEALDRMVDIGAEGRERYGTAGRARAEELWAWPALLDRMEDAYAEAIEARQRKLGEAA